ncbi:angiomotin-like [Sorghum bicolor]|uniref:angiomotin-like n=1 Tax=Sorghum bicolor TaxID=4558 RepID=UPI000B42487C|nr:angiomotin-like [Sorghum bicolor]|eukprot:XP_021319204.1 angiomotin-like [Sorghum bicolor]
MLLGGGVLVASSSLVEVLAAALVGAGCSSALSAAVVAAGYSMVCGAASPMAATGSVALWPAMWPGAASDVNPDQASEQGTAAPVAAAEDAAPQVTEQPAAAAGAEDQSAPASAATSTQPRDEEAARVPPPSTVVEEESRVPTPPAEEGRDLTPPRAGASSPVGSSGLGQGPVMPSTAAGGSAANEEPQEASDNDVEEV